MKVSTLSNFVSAILFGSAAIYPVNTFGARVFCAFLCFMCLIGFLENLVE